MRSAIFADRLKMVWLTNKIRGDHVILHVTVNGTGLILDDRNPDILDDEQYHTATKSGSLARPCRSHHAPSQPFVY